MGRGMGQGGPTAIGPADARARASQANPAAFRVSLEPASPVAGRARIGPDGRIGMGRDGPTGMGQAGIGRGRPT